MRFLFLDSHPMRLRRVVQSHCQFQHGVLRLQYRPPHIRLYWASIRSSHQSIEPALHRCHLPAQRRSFIGCQIHELKVRGGVAAGNRREEVCSAVNGCAQSTTFPTIVNVIFPRNRFAFGGVAVSTML
jgi:hypothetical protein